MNPNKASFERWCARSSGTKPLPLSYEEMEQLKSQGNVLSKGAVLLGSGSDLSEIFSSIFSGYIVFPSTGKCNISFSSLENVCLEEEVCMQFCSRVQNVYIERDVKILNSSIRGSWSSYGLGKAVSVGIETGGREIFYWPEMSIDRLEAPEFFSYAAGYSFIGRNSVIDNTALRNVYLYPFCVVDGATAVEDSFICCSKGEPVRISAGSVVRRSLLQWGVSVSDLSIVEDSALLEHSYVERHGKVFSSVIGPNTGVAEGEVTASLVGPFVGFHHQSLLIAAWWPEGRGNVAYGANIGSNHTSRQPDQEIWPGEGLFFGLDSAVKYPCNFREAPYSIIAFGVTMQPQKVTLPFSLFKTHEEIPKGVRADFNRIIPGWVLSDNIYGIMRNEGKYKSRDKSRRIKLDTRIFRQEIVDKMCKACEELENLSGKDVYTYLDYPGIGKNYLYERDRKKAIEAYLFYIEYFALMGLFREKTGVADSDVNFQKSLLALYEWDKRGDRQNLERYVEILEQIAKDILNSRKKDELRGPRIIDDYAETHSPAKEDAFVKQFQKRVQEEKKLLEDLSRP